MEATNHWVSDAAARLRVEVFRPDGRTPVGVAEARSGETARVEVTALERAYAVKVTDANGRASLSRR